MLERLLHWNLPPTAQGLVNVVLIWFGFALVTGLIARMIVPGRRGRGPWATLLVGLTGSCLGPLVTTTLLHLDDFNPIGFFGLLVSVAAAVVALLLFHLILLIFPPKTDQPPKKE